jgi:IclR family KDG regulon transcriptional repressor
MPESPGLRTLERGLSVLELLGAAEGGLPVSEVAQRLKLPMGTTHRLLQTLMHAGYVEQDPRTRRYELGLKILELRGAIGGAMRIAAEARPFLRDLMVRTGLRAHLAMYRGGGVVYIDRVDNAATLNQFVPIGRRAHAHATGLGKALLAHASEDELAAFLAHHDLRKLTPTTLTDAGDLRDELAAVRRRGFALDRGESHLDTRCVAAPVFDYTGRAIAAVSVAGAPDEVEPRSSDLAQIVMELAGAISQQFGYRSPGQSLLPGRDTLFIWESGPTNASRGTFDE